MTWKLIGLGFGFFVCTMQTPAYALQTLDTFLQGATKNNYDNQRAVLAMERSLQDTKVALGRILPSLTATATYTRNEPEVRLMQFGLDLVLTQQNQLDAVFNVNVPLLDTAGIMRVLAGKNSEQAAALRQKDILLAVQKAVARAYYQLTGVESLVRANKEALAAAEANLQTVRTRFGVGTVLRLAVNRAEAEVERVRREQADALYSLAVTRRQLETLTGVMPQEGAEEIQDGLQSESDVSDWEQKAGQVPSVRASQWDLAAAQRQVQAAKLALLPTLSLTGGGRCTNATGFVNQYCTGSVAISLGGRWDFSTGFTISTSEIATKTAQVNANDTARQARDQIHNAWQLVQSSIAKSHAARAQEKAAKQAAEDAQIQYQGNTATEVEVIQAIRDWRAASAARIQADADVRYARALLRLSAGELLSS